MCLSQDFASPEDEATFAGSRGARNIVRFFLACTDYSIPCRRALGRHRERALAARVPRPKLSLLRRRSDQETGSCNRKTKTVLYAGMSRSPHTTRPPCCIQRDGARPSKHGVSQCFWALSFCAGTTAIATQTRQYSMMGLGHAGHVL